MMRRTTAPIAKLCTVAALLTLGATAVMQVGSTAPISAAVSTVTLLAWATIPSVSSATASAGGVVTRPWRFPFPPE